MKKMMTKALMCIMVMSTFMLTSCEKSNARKELDRTLITFTMNGSKDTGEGIRIDSAFRNDDRTTINMSVYGELAYEFDQELSGFKSLNESVKQDFLSGLRMTPEGSQLANLCKKAETDIVCRIHNLENGKTYTINIEWEKI